ncbi:MAG: nucleotidyltransferase family protein [Chloroflexota bacterium]|jgi:predicted nucleotidyltransferase|nr:nucleotidyltransferase family protein [Anaerolineae bacterium]HMM28797.1 nucleotidyltransferase family protein [Aggregatilineaceae bacterium]
MGTSKPRISVSSAQIAAFCQRWNVIEFALFGSVLRDDFTPESDVDVLLSFAPGTVYKFKDLAAMEVELSTIFGRRVDVVDKDAVHASPNYLRRRAILSSAEVIYAA